ncbi:unnamed protein product [Nezara viridula]|uniref:Uncharacterized protein n=1 Tax=Nezara viridula TaxID=85310 RepID=A0A9P0MQ78_NEZVI|nr:unnamed protein product [Nezara viridula]
MKGAASEERVQDGYLRANISPTVPKQHQAIPAELEWCDWRRPMGGRHVIGGEGGFSSLSSHCLSPDIEPEARPPTAFIKLKLVHILSDSYEGRVPVVRPV